MAAFFDGGSIKTASQVAYSIDTAIALGKTEAQIIAEIEAYFDVEYPGTAPHSFTNLRIAVPGESALPYLNKTNGNYLFDVNNPLSKTLYDAGYGVGIGGSCEWSTTEANSDFVNSVTSPHYTTDDGFAGELYSRNVDSDGDITNAAKDAAWVTKEYDFSTMIRNVKQINFSGLLNELNIGDQADLEVYIASSINTPLKNVFNSSAYTFSYDGTDLTIDFPRMNFGDAQQEINRLSDVIINQIEKGSYNKDTGRILFSNSANYFRFIFVKRHP
jgi:hypothetical protein